MKTPAPADGGDELQKPDGTWRCMHLMCGRWNSDASSGCFACGMPYGSLDVAIEALRLQDRNALVEQLEAAKETLNKDTDDATTAVICGGNAALDAAKWLIHDHYED